MPKLNTAQAANSLLPKNFGSALRFLRKRAHLTQDALGMAVGYSREQIARLENHLRQPDVAVVTAIFVPILLEEWEADLTTQFIGLAAQARQAEPATKTPVGTRHTPPAPLLPLIGRAAALEDALRCLQHTRLLTLVGAPGIGKTRLALEMAQHAQSWFTDGAAFISLVGCAQPNEIGRAVLTQLNILTSPEQHEQQAIRAYFAPRHLLVVLDNCEHLLEGVSTFTEWLEHAPNLKLLCTSRVELDLYGEMEYPLNPLALPDSGKSAPLEVWQQNPAMLLLLQRAQAIDPSFTLNTENFPTLAQLCVALDGLPLALELAAVRLREFSPETLLQELLTLRRAAGQASALLHQTRRNVSERHRTLQTAIAWSVRLLPAATQAAFYKLGVFWNGCTADSAAQIAGCTPEILTELQRANLIHLRAQRVTLLETLRAYALEQLEALAQSLPTQKLHAQHFTAFAQQVFDGIQGSEQDLWMQYAQNDHENCLAALRWALTQCDGDTAIALAGALWWFWYRRGLFDLGRTNLSDALALPSQDTAARANALNGLANFCLAQEDFTAALTYHQQGLALRRAQADSAGIATALHNLGLTFVMMGDFTQALQFLHESVQADPAADPTLAWAHMGFIAQELQDLPQARHWLQQAYARLDPQETSWTRAFVANLLADVLRESGEIAAAVPLAQTSRALFAALDDTYYLPDAEMTLAQIAIDEKNWQTAQTLSQKVLQQYQARTDAAAMSGVLLLQAELALQMHLPEQAARLLKHARSLRTSVRRALSPREVAQYANLEQQINS